MNFSEWFDLPVYTDYYAYATGPRAKKTLIQQELALPSFIAVVSCKATGSVPAEP
jgi:hypothetical protein